MGRQDARQKKIRRRDKGQKKWGDEMQDGKKMGRRETRPKKWGDEMQDKKNGEMRRKTKKNGETR